MAGLFDKQEETYVKTRPVYPKEWFSWFADRTSDHLLAWDVGTGIGQAAVAMAEHYSQVIATDVAIPPFERTIQHPRVKFVQTPPTLSTNDLISLFGPEPDNSVDLITAAQAVNWFDLPNFYAAATRVLKPGGIIAVWCYCHLVVTPELEPFISRFEEAAFPYFPPGMKHVFDGYKTLPFPFEDVGLGKEGEAMPVDIVKTVSFQGFIGLWRSWYAVPAAKAKGVDLLDEDFVKEMECAWGGSEVIRDVVYRAHMLVGRAIKGKDGN